MNAKRQKTQDFICNYIDKLAGKENREIYENLFKAMTDEDFDKFMKQLRDKETNLLVVMPNDGKNRVSVEKNLSLANELGFSFYEQINVKNDPEVSDYKTPMKYLVAPLPIRRAQQLLTKKVSMPTHNLSTNPLTGQVANESRAAKITYPEMQIGIAMNMKDILTEIVSIRGGDQGAAKSLNDQLFKTGYATQEEAMKSSTGVKSKETLFRWLRGMHINSTL